MAMTVMNNPSAMMTLGELNKNVSNLGKQLKKVATGTKITGAGDGAAEYNIAEKMQSQIRGLAQDIENTRTGRSILKVAEGGIQGIVDELRDMKQLAINAANDTNTDVDRATIQKEFDQKLQQIDDIVSSTNYNGKLLLDGTYARKVYVAGKEEYVGGPKGATATSVASTGPENVETWPSDGVIQYGGAYTIPDGYTGTITIKSPAAAGGVKLSQAGAALNNVNIEVEAPASGGGKLWIDNLNITNNTGNNSIIQFNGSDNTLTLIGSNVLNLDINAATSAVVDMGDGLTVQGNGSELSIVNKKNSKGPGIGSDAGQETSGNLKVINATITINNYDGAGIGSGAGTGSGVGDLTITNSTINLTGHYNAGIGAGASGGSVGDILVEQSTINMVYMGNGNDILGDPYGNVDTCIGSAVGSEYCGNITVKDSVVTSNGQLSPAIGAGDGSNCKDILIDNSDLTSLTTEAAGVGSGQGGSTTGDITVIHGSKIKHTSNHGAAIGSGANGHVGKITIDSSSLKLLDASDAYIDPSHKIPGIGKGYGGTADDSIPPEVIPTDPVIHDGNPLKIHTGTRANQRINCWIENLGTKSIFCSDPPKRLSDAELDSLVNVRTRESAQHLLGDVSDPSIEGPLDKAINYVLGEITQVGSYINRLEATEETITINHENTTSSESVIRDADMAKEMTEYTKANVLAQAAQSMLAQANQNSSSVLSLLQ